MKAPINLDKRYEQFIATLPEDMKTNLAGVSIGCLLTEEEYNDMFPQIEEVVSGTVTFSLPEDEEN